MRISLDHTKIGLADQITLEQTIVAEQGFVVDLPEFGGEELPEIENFTVVDLDRIDETESQSGVRTFGRRFTLESMRSGKLTIPPLYAYFHKDGQRTEAELVSEPIEIEIAAIEDVDSLALKSVKEIIRPEQIISPVWPWVAGIGGGFAVLACVVTWLVRRERSAAPVRSVPAHEWAYDAMQDLIDSGLVEQGEYERFFVGLSAILREYMERRFGLHAPDRTTEEFLEEASQNPTLTGHQRRLREFLTFADLVKFATYQPGESDVQRSFDSLKLFIEETKIVGV
jgi:hypothetical protein